MITPAIFHAGSIDVAIPGSAVVTVEREALIAEALFAQFSPVEIALAVVEITDARLASGRWHYRSRGGLLLVHLDEVCRALESNDLASIPPIS